MAADQDIVHRDVTNDQLVTRILDVCEVIGEFIEYWGFKAVLGRIWAILALSEAPLSQAEIARLLGVSRSLVSGSVAELTERGLVRPTGTNRNAPYEAVIDVWPSISDVLRSREWMLIEKSRVALEAALDEVQLAKGAGEVLAWNEERLNFLLTMTETAQAFLRLLIRMRSAPGVEGLGKWFTRAATLLRHLRGSAG